jgi:hypothetical protein
LQPYTIEIRARRKNKAGLPLIDAMVPGITPPNGYPIPLNLTEEQAAMIVDGETQYNCHLVRGSLKNGKDGSWDTDYYWDVAMFVGVPNQRVIDSYNNEPADKMIHPVTGQVFSTLDGAASPAPQKPAPQKPAAPAVSPDERQLIYMRQTGLNCASNLMASIVKDFENPEMMYQRTVELSERFVGYLATGQSDGLVDTLIQEGANITGIRDEEPEYTYPPVPDKVTSATFNEYCTRAGWLADDVREWLGGLELVDWIEQGEGRSTKAALQKCREDAIEQGVLLPPEDFRAEAKN